VSGTTTIGRWRTALDAVQHRHPLLSVRIDGSGGAPRFESVTGCGIPMEVVDGDAGARWEDAMESALAVAFGEHEAPLARAVLVHQDRDIPCSRAGVTRSEIASPTNATPFAGRTIASNSPPTAGAVTDRTSI
jgi:hypothetical protein